ncbi:MAG TPA: phosphoribosyltransferase [Candidatus Bathyarchaeia archaeon]|nr:phosphoribosyltransferase [Candidatus Bathyarchaeia archaeon]
MNNELEFEVPTWNQIYDMLLNMATKIRQDKFKPDIIIGVSRGGWPPARVLSDLLDNPNLASVTVEFYVGVAETKRKPTLTQPVSAKIKDKKVLVVDEVTDTGKSLKLVKEYIIKQGVTQVKTATIYYKPWSIIKPDYCEKETSRWIVFPWETKETVRKILQKSSKKGKDVEQETAKLVKAGVPKKLVKKFLNEILEEQ